MKKDEKYYKIVHDQLSVLRSQTPALAQILECSPFDIEKDIHGTIRKELFYEYIFYCDQQYNDALKELDSLINCPSFVNRIIFYYGFAGIGKTTFLHRYEEISESMKHIFIDFQKVVRLEKIQKNDLAPKEDVSPIKEALNQYLKDQIDNPDIDTNYFINFIIKNSECLNGFMNEQLYDFNDNLIEFKNYINKLYLQDSFTLFMIYQYIMQDSTKKIIIYFDNMDAAEIEYLSADFTEILPKYLDTVHKLSRTTGVFPNVNFVANYKFVFCMRESNFAKSNSHDYDRLWPNTISKQMDYMFSKELYIEIINHRYNFIHNYIYSYNKEMYPGYRKYILEIIRTITNDSVFNNYLLPLFNNDIRKLLVVIFQLSEDYSVIPENFIVIYRHNKYGAMGNIVFGITQKLVNENFLTQITKQKINLKEYSVGLCHPLRVIISYILNTMNRGKNTKEFNFKNDSISILKILTDFKDIYSSDTIFDTLINAFMIHEYNWKHLITIYNINIKNKNSFDDEKLFFNTYREYIDGITMSKDEEIEIYENKDFMLNRLSRAKIIVNPASFSFLKYLNTHYEYYSVLADNEKPLFYPPGLGISKDKSLYSYIEENIERVFQIVEKHVILMMEFYDHIYLKRGVIKDDEDFFISDFSFKFFGPNAVYSSNGFFHTTRLLTSIIQYLDNYRLHILNDNTRGKDKEWLLYPEEFNRIMVTEISKFNDLLSKQDDRKSFKFRKKFGEKIKIIIKSKYNDITTKIDATKKG